MTAESKSGVQPAGRGVVLTIWLVLYSAAVLVGLVAALVVASKDLDHGQNLTIPMVLGIIALVSEAIALAALWLWQRWGAALVAIAVGVWLLAAAMSGVAGLVISARIVAVCALLFVLAPRWEKFRS
ncbi:hypothetical protein AB0I60_00210 [Actinosynnema sp. NPDC050436]|uniref:hypothetical protein n=1 Tax=Actinosynnema sp. NPDC050436 TaxID=3155659 RepID=UPI0033EFC177